MIEDREQEVRQLLRFTCERLARTMMGKSSASRIRIVARKVEDAALQQAIALRDSFNGTRPTEGGE